MKKQTSRVSFRSQSSCRPVAVLLTWLLLGLIACSRTTVSLDASGGSDGGTGGDPQAGVVSTGGVAASTCGDGRVDGSEQCDPPGILDCKGLALGSGQAQCSDACKLDTSACVASTSCDVSQSAVSDACEKALCACDPIATSQCDQTCFDTIACALAKCPDRDPNCVLTNCGGTFSSALLQLVPCIQSSPECTGATPGFPKCGDGVIDPGEECDGSGTSCQAFGLGNGMTQCDPVTCTNTFDTCEFVENVCGDSIARDTEQCDGNDLMGETCKDRGFVGGTLSCASDCSFDASQCHLCGDGIREDPESCDGADLRGLSCMDFGYSGGSLSCLSTCADFDVSKCAVCGNGVVEEGESCDGTMLPGDCSTVGLGTGSLTCSASDCHLDTSGCSVSASCGDGVVQTGETCDGTNLLGQSCTSLGFAGGTLSCNPTTCRLVAVNCTERDPNECINDCIDSRCTGVLDQCDATPNCNQALQCVDTCHDTDVSTCVLNCSLNDINAATTAFAATQCVYDCTVGCQ